MTPEEEREYISRVLSGDRNAFEALVEANQRNVYNLAYKMTRNEEDALDISQEAFFKAYKSLASFRSESKFSVWLYRLTYNLCVDLARKKSRASVVSMSVADDSDETVEVQIPDVRALPEEEVERRELRHAITEGIAALPEKHRAVLLMREDSGLSYTDIALALDISEGTVKSRISRARRALMTLLVQNGTFSEAERHKDRKGVE